eukprot:765501-Hanusia_phi.AAC.2
MSEETKRESTVKKIKKMKKMKKRDGDDKIDYHLKKFERIASWHIRLDHLSYVLDNYPREGLDGEEWYKPLMCVLPYMEKECLSEILGKLGRREEDAERLQEMVNDKRRHRYPNTIVSGGNHEKEKQIRNFEKKIDIPCFMDLKKYGERVKTTMQYINSEDLKIDKDVFIISSLGSGKTTAVIDYLRESKKQFIFVVHLRNLIADIKHNLKKNGLTVRSYETDKLEYFFNENDNCNWIVSYNSLFKLVREEYISESGELRIGTKSFDRYTIIFDEFKSSIEYLYTAATFNTLRMKCIHTFVKMLKTSDKVIMMDGNMSEDEMDLYKRWRSSDKDYIILNSTFKNFNEKEAIQVSEYDEIRGMILNESMNTVEGCYVCCNTREPMYDLYNYVIGHINNTIEGMNEDEIVRLQRMHNCEDVKTYLTSRVIYIASDTDRVKSEYSGDVNSKWKNKVIITTPSIIEGVSYVSETPVTTYCISTFARTLTPAQKIQQLCRSRNCRALYFYIHHKLTTPYNMICTGMPVHSDIEDCMKTYNGLDVMSYLSSDNSIVLKTKELRMINREMMSINNEEGTMLETTHNKILMRIIYKQDTQYLCYEYYYMKYLSRLGFNVIPSYIKESKAIKKEKKIERQYNEEDIMKFLKSRNMQMNKELKELGILKDMDEKMFDKTIGELSLEHTRKIHEASLDRIEFNEDQLLTKLQTEYKNRINFYFKKVKNEDMREYFKEFYKNVLIGAEGYKHDIHKASTRNEDPLLLHNKIIAFITKRTHLERELEEMMREDNPIHAYRSIYMRIYMTKRIIWDHLGNDEIDKMEYLDTSRLRDEEMEISEELSKYFNVPKRISHRKLVNLVRVNMNGLWISRRIRFDEIKNGTI